MNLAFPHKYHEVVKYFDYYVGDLEATTLLTDMQKLMFYALRQQADHGQCTTSAPPMWKVTERKKHQAWKQLECMSTFEAMVFFVQHFEEVLMQLEKSAAPLANTSAPDAREAPFDWASRLRKMELERTAELDSTQHSSSPLDSDDARVIANSCAPSHMPHPITVDEKVCQITSPSIFTDGEKVAWDADVLAHSTATLDNIRYLATELMTVRLALRKLREDTERCVEQKGSSACINGPANQESAVYRPLPVPNPIDTGSLGKPISSSSGIAAHISMVAPPMRPSARSMTEAAVSASSWASHLKMFLDPSTYANLEHLTGAPQLKRMAQ